MLKAILYINILRLKNAQLVAVEERVSERYHCRVTTLNNNSDNFKTIATLQSDNVEAISGFSLARWKVDQNSVAYCNSDSHTLSLYLSGGDTTYRTDQAHLKGAPGKICLMPQGHQSKWHINGDIDFIHLYFSDELVRYYASTILQSDVRFIDIKDLLYQEDQQLKNLIFEYAKLADEPFACSPLFAEQAAHKIIHHLILHHNGFALKEYKVRGGLSPKHMKLIRNYISQNLDQKLTIEGLSKITDLSPFHFARMFKLSFGEPPANFIIRSRIEMVKSLLSTNIPLAIISMKAGFSQQSHMTNSFRKLVGVTPAVFRKRTMAG